MSVRDFAALPVYAFSIDQNNGGLSPVTGSPFSLGVAGVRTDFTGKFAVGLSGVLADNHLYVFAIDPNTGALTAVNNSPFATIMAEPENLRIHPSSQFVYSLRSWTTTALLRPLRVSPLIPPQAP